MTALIEQIKRDREYGTPGPWRIKNCESHGHRCVNFHQEVWNDDTDILVTTEVTRAHNDGGSANVRRIARVPELEAALLAADELARAVEARTDVLGGYDDRFSVQKALTAYRKATSGSGVE